MNQVQVEAALVRAHNAVAPDVKITRCTLARAVLAFLEELNGSASWIERRILSVVRQLVRHVIEDCRSQPYP